MAICEQVGEQPVKGLFPRQVARVVTPGTVIEPGLLPGDANNYLACVVVESESDGGQAGRGVAYVDITTGEFAATELSGEDIQAALRAELARLRPAEVLHPEDLGACEMGCPGHLTSLAGLALRAGTLPGGAAAPFPGRRAGWVRAARAGGWRCGRRGRSCNT